jgi:hypothetical protein
MISRVRNRRASSFLIALFLSLPILHSESGHAAGRALRPFPVAAVPSGESGAVESSASTSPSGEVSAPEPGLSPSDGSGETASVRKLEKFEPERGCYIGAFIERDYTVQGDIGAWEQLTKKRHASYFTYVGYGRPFPSEWVEKLKKSGASPQIAWEPNDGLEMVQDGPYLRAWARDAARSRSPIFLRWASEMNGPWTAYGKDPALYIEKFRLISKVMKEEAPNVAMVWTPFAEPVRLIDAYYPGDDWVDWVGMNIYAVYVNNGDPFRPAAQKDIIAWLRWIHDNYGPRKPVHISEFAATIFCKGTSEDTVPFAVDRMKKFYGAIRDQFPRVKSVNWFCWDTIRAKRANNNYSIIDDGRALAAYRRLVADPHFLDRVAYDESAWPRIVKPGTTLGPNGIALVRNSGTDESLWFSGALQGQMLRDENTSPVAPSRVGVKIAGLEPGVPIAGDLKLRAELLGGIKASDVKAVHWQVDGRIVWMTNSAPFDLWLAVRRLTPGLHSVRVLAYLKSSDQPLQSSDLEFEVGD